MIRNFRLIAPVAILIASCLPVRAQSEPAALPVTPVQASPQPEPAPEPAIAPKIAPAKPAPAAPADDSKARIARLESDLAAARADLKAAKSQATSAGSKVKDERTRAEAEREKLQAQIADLTADRDHAQALLEQARTNLASANERLAIYEKTIREGAPVDADELRAALGESQKKVDMTVRAFSVIEQENNRIHAQLKDVDPKQLSNDLEDARQALASAQRDLAAEKTRSSNLARELSRARPGTPLVIEEPPVPSAPTHPSAVPEEAAPAADVKMHVVADGENLSMISKRYYGTASRWLDIYNANRDVLKDENHVAAGTKLRIP